MVRTPIGHIIRRLKDERDVYIRDLINLKNDRREVRKRMRKVKAVAPGHPILAKGQDYIIDCCRMIGKITYYLEKVESKISRLVLT